jgi:radical SAM superfamily enzyme YgiQ (UPF0313 family)
MSRGPVALVGAEFEENLSLRYLASSISLDGFDPFILAFNTPADASRIAEHIVERSPSVVGISVPFQARAPELLGLGTTLRERGFEGHVCAGGHFATFEYENILRDFPAVDSVVRHEGEETFRELCRSVRSDSSPVGLPGVVCRDGEGLAIGPKRPLPALDEHVFPRRRAAPQRVLGIGSAPIVGSRGCYADCSFCCIYAYADNADGPRYRRRSPENIAREMAEEYHGRGVRVFVFNDDNFFVPSPQKNLDRYRRLNEALRAEEVDEIGLVIKCRPNDVDPELFDFLKTMGMIRAYVGIETNSDEGIVSLNRRITREDNRRALERLRALGVYASFNLLIFDPEATLPGVERNLDFMEEFADFPSNFCRAEVYAGTPLKAILERQGRLEGDYRAWGYGMRNPRVELLFRIATTAFMARNFKPDGVANLNMGIRFDNEVMKRFYPDCWDGTWQMYLEEISRRIAYDSVARMREAHAFVGSVSLTDHDVVRSFTIELARRVARSDLQFIRQIKAARREMEQRVLSCTGAAVRGTRDDAAPWAAESSRLGTSVGLEVSSESLPIPNLT